MKKFFVLFIIVLFVIVVVQIIVVVQFLFSLGLCGLEFGVFGGYVGGLNGEVFVYVLNVVGLVGVKFSVLQIFVSDVLCDDVSVNLILGLGIFGSYKQQGLVIESGSYSIYVFDGIYNLGQVGCGVDLIVYVGGCYGIFSVIEIYVGDVVFLQIICISVFGVGVGVMFGYCISDCVSLIGDFGVDQYFNGVIINGIDVGIYQIGEVGYNDVCVCFVFFGIVFKVKVGVKFNF